MTLKKGLEVVWVDFGPPGAVGAEEKFSRFLVTSSRFGSPIPTIPDLGFGPSLTKKNSRGLRKALVGAAS